MILQKGLKVGEAARAEKEGINSSSETGECKVGGGEKSAWRMIGAVQASLVQRKLKSGKFRRQKLDDLQHLRGRNDNVVNTVNYSIGSKLDIQLVFPQKILVTITPLTMSIATTRL